MLRNSGPSGLGLFTAPGVNFPAGSVVCCYHGFAIEEKAHQQMRGSVRGRYTMKLCSLYFDAYSTTGPGRYINSDLGTPFSPNCYLRGDGMILKTP